MNAHSARRAGRQSQCRQVALFNALTGARQKIGNYPGVTVERHSGRLALNDGRPVELVDLPGTYSLDPSSPRRSGDARRRARQTGGRTRPDALIVVADASNLENHLRFVLQLRQLGRPMVVALNMIDMATRDGLTIDADALSRSSACPGRHHRRGAQARPRRTARVALDGVLRRTADPPRLRTPDADASLHFQRDARRIAALAIITDQPRCRAFTRAVDNVVLHPVAGWLILIALFFVMFQAVYTWSEAPIGWIEGTQEWLGAHAQENLPSGFIGDLVVQGIIAGVGSVVVFLPQILILFFFILLLEATGYMVRAAFLMDRLMSLVGLSGRAFIPLLSSFACAIPGIMAARSIDDPKGAADHDPDRPADDLLGAAPVYMLIIGAFIPARDRRPEHRAYRGWCCSASMSSGIVGAILAAFVLRLTATRGKSGGFMMEMPRYQLPSLRDLLIGLWQRAYVFLRRAGTIIRSASPSRSGCSPPIPSRPRGVKQSEYSSPAASQRASKSSSPRSASTMK
jgi:ferrous iron transport protein B